MGVFELLLVEQLVEQLGHQFVELQLGHQLKVVQDSLHENTFEQRSQLRKL